MFLLPDPLRPDILEPEQKTRLLCIPSGVDKRHLSCVEWWSQRRLSIEAEMDRKVLVQVAGETDGRHAPLPAAWRFWDLWCGHVITFPWLTLCLQHSACTASRPGWKTQAPWGRRGLGWGLPQGLQRAVLSPRTWLRSPSPWGRAWWNQHPINRSGPSPQAQEDMLHLLNCSIVMEVSPNARGLLGEIVQGYNILSECKSILYCTVISMAISILSESLWK